MAFADEKAILQLEGNEADASSSHSLLSLSEQESYTPQRAYRIAPSLTSRFTLRQIRYALAFAAALIFVINLSYFSRSWHTTVTPSLLMAGGKPEGLRVIGLVFYGRPIFVDILDCYLEKNLVINGGYLDEVHFMVHTENEDHLKWLDGLVNNTEQYKIFPSIGDGYADIWKQATEPNTIYVKIDDDIVYIHDDAIPRIVHTLIAQPNSYAVASNLINSPLSHWLHYHTVAIRPFLPEPHRPSHLSNATVSWRTSELPTYPGRPPRSFNFEKWHKAPYAGHRWLPLANTSSNLMKTPIARAEYNAWGMALGEWSMAAQQHYSFFANAEQGLLNRYWAGNQDGIWNMQYDRYNINFLAIWGRTVQARPFWFDPEHPNDENDVAEKGDSEDGDEDDDSVTFTDADLQDLDFDHDGEPDGKMWDDEDAMSVIIPRELERPLLVDTHALVAHFSFGPQNEQLLRTDLLDRYRAYANEFACRANNQKVVLDSKWF